MFSRVLPKSYPKAFWHRGARCSPRASRKFGLTYQGSYWILLCWNRASRQVFLAAAAHGSVISWQHINLLGEYDFSDEKLQDTVGIRPPKLTP